MSQLDEDLQALLRKVENTHSAAEQFIADVLNIVDTFQRNADNNVLCMQKAVVTAAERTISQKVTALNGNGATPPAPPVGRGGDPMEAIRRVGPGIQ